MERIPNATIGRTKGFEIMNKLIESVHGKPRRKCHGSSEM